MNTPQTNAPAAPMTSAWPVCCGTCNWWERQSPGAEFGHCQRHHAARLVEAETNGDDHCLSGNRWPPIPGGNTLSERTRQ